MFTLAYLYKAYVKMYYLDASFSSALPVEPAPAQESRSQHTKGRLFTSPHSIAAVHGGKKLIKDLNLTQSKNHS